MFLQDYIGNTPLVTLQRLGAGRGNRISVKLEGNNPAGSVKDRAAFSMIRHAETPVSLWRWSRQCAVTA